GELGKGQKTLGSVGGVSRWSIGGSMVSSLFGLRMTEKGERERTEMEMRGEAAVSLLWSTGAATVLRLKCQCFIVSGGTVREMRKGVKGERREILKGEGGFSGGSGFAGAVEQK
ncbi:hypothetical protein HAX54_012933, partial [Datura stramonium]|nr:hypothetical protein [Datura stramonium]